jgi:hypothetical protein
MNVSQNIPLYTDTSTSWHNAGVPSDLTVNLDTGVNEYQFGRTTPNNKFVVSTGLVNKPYGVEMVGGSKKKSKPKTNTKKPSATLLNKIKKSFENIKALVGLKSDTKKIVVKKSTKSKPLSDKKKKVVKKLTKSKPLSDKKKKVVKKSTKSKLLSDKKKKVVKKMK